MATPLPSVIPVGTWVRTLDEGSGNSYYFQLGTGVTAWDPPGPDCLVIEDVSVGGAFDPGSWKAPGAAEPAADTDAAASVTEVVLQEVDPTSDAKPDAGQVEVKQDGDLAAAAAASAEPATGGIEYAGQRIPGTPWVKNIFEETGQPYWFNIVTSESTWTDPVAAAEQPADAKARGQQLARRRSLFSADRKVRASSYGNLLPVTTAGDTATIDAHGPEDEHDEQEKIIAGLRNQLTEAHKRIEDLEALNNVMMGMLVSAGITPPLQSPTAASPTVGTSVNTTPAAVTTPTVVLAAPPASHDASTNGDATGGSSPPAAADQQRRRPRTSTLGARSIGSRKSVLTTRHSIHGTMLELPPSPTAQFIDTPEVRNSLLKSVPLFHTFSEEQFLKLTQQLALRSYEPGQLIIRQGDAGDQFFIIASGSVQVHKRDASHGDGSLGNVIADLGQGSFFGERALLTKEPRAASCVATTNVVCYVLDRESFSLCLSAVQNLLGDFTALYAHTTEAARLNRHIKMFQSLITDAGHTRSTRLLPLISAFVPELGLSALFQQATKVMSKSLNAQAILLFGPADGNFSCLGSTQSSGKADLKAGLSVPAKSIVGHTFASAEPIRIDNVRSHPRFTEGADSWTAAQGAVDAYFSVRTQSLLLVPIVDPSQNVRGVFMIVNRVDADTDQIVPFEDADLGFVAQVADLLAVESAYRVAPARCTPQAEMREKFTVKLIWLTASPVTAGKPMTAQVVASLFCGVVRLHPDVTSPTAVVAAESGKAVWDCDLEFSYFISDLPVASRIIFNVLLTDGTPIGWGGFHLFSVDKVLLAGNCTVKLFPGHGSPASHSTMTVLSNAYDANHTAELQVLFPIHEKPVVVMDADRRKLALIRSRRMGSSMAVRDTAAGSGSWGRVQQILAGDPLQSLSQEDTQLLWDNRLQLMEFPAALPKVLLAVDWSNPCDVYDILKLLNTWTPPTPLQALELLDAKYADPLVRAYAVRLLEPLEDTQLQLYMLQLTQVLKFEQNVDSALGRFLLRRAIRNPLSIGHMFFWYLRAEMHIAWVRPRYGVLLECYLRACGDHREHIGHQLFVMSRLEAVAMKVKDASSEERLTLARKQLGQIVFPPSFQLPLNPDLVACGLNVDGCRVMSSKKLPLWLSFKRVSKDPTPPIVVLFKCGDDLRQDQLTLQILNIMNKLWMAEDLDLRMSPYQCVSTGDEVGMLQVVLNSDTLAGIVSDSVNKRVKDGVTVKASGLRAKVRAAMNVYLNVEVIREWLTTQCEKHSYTWEDVHENFIRSCAGYCVATYVLGIGDRHNDNIMLTKDGKLFHIDFGHFLGNFKSKFGYKREKAPFVFTPQFANVIGKTDGPEFARFESLCCQAYNVLRKHGNHLITLFNLMISCGIPELEHEEDISWLRDKLMMTASDEEAAASFKALILESMNTKTTLFNDACHLLKHG